MSGLYQGKFLDAASSKHLAEFHVQIFVMSMFIVLYYSYQIFKDGPSILLAIHPLRISKCGMANDLVSYVKIGHYEYHSLGICPSSLDLLAFQLGKFPNSFEMNSFIFIGRGVIYFNKQIYNLNAAMYFATFRKSVHQHITYYVYLTLQHSST